ncbi:phosphoserine phosphatase 1 [bacterium BMS3Bbin14]|nr:phosphoserine phosphatase 1 [bacterium BMS3Abin13]GBE53821.1 phosphoserine phosphatase 1 [bacterium BMS3Bbin14]HDK44485.1 histidine phosphatase family protein [Desulfobacteraceae bacterium]HDO30290.1 histidine phosphatase family protein [Desulfobacteraceae bacterium]
MNENKQEIWLVRHGETAWAATGRHTGRTDIPLTETGVLQGKTLGPRLADHPFALVLASPLKRAAETCRLAGYGERAEFSDELLEWDYGLYEGRTTTDIRTEKPGWSIWTDDPPGGESLAQVARRADMVIARVAALDGDSLIFAHAHMLRVFAARWLGLSPDAGRLLSLNTASLSILGHEHENRVIIIWNNLCHLPDAENR